MDSDLAYADCRLDSWASWVKGGMSAWPNMTLLGRLIEQGATAAAQMGRGVETMPDDILATDRAVAHLDGILKHVTIIYYLTYADSDVKARRCHCSRATFWRRVQRAQKQIAFLLQNPFHAETQQRYLRAS